METNLRAYPRPLGWWRKSDRGSVMVVMDKRLMMTCIQHHPEEKGWSHTCQNASTIATKTVNWRIYEGRLGS